MLVCPTTFELIKIGDYDPPIEKNKTKKNPQWNTLIKSVHFKLKVSSCLFDLKSIVVVYRDKINKMMSCPNIYIPDCILSNYHFYILKEYFKKVA